MAVYNFTRDGRPIEDLSKIVIDPDNCPLVYEVFYRVIDRQREEAREKARAKAVASA